MDDGGKGMILSERFDTALAMASDLHRQQMRKGTTTPYVAHLLAVTAIVLEHGGTEDQAIAALLHDAPEDQGGRATLERIRDHFGDGVAGIVEDCTDTFEEPKPEWLPRKVSYLKHLEHLAEEAAVLVSAADKLHNLRAIRSDYSQHGDDFGAGSAVGPASNCGTSRPWPPSTPSASPDGWRTPSTTRSSNSPLSSPQEAHTSRCLPVSDLESSLQGRARERAILKPAQDVWREVEPDA